MTLDLNHLLGIAGKASQPPHHVPADELRPVFEAYADAFKPATVTALILRAQAAEKALKEIAALPSVRPRGDAGSHQRGYDIGWNQARLTPVRIASEALASFTPMEEMGKSGGETDAD